MKPEKILESDMLDIVFENRNKEYGAYELRRNYNRRVQRALGGTVLIVALFAITQSFKVTRKTGHFVPEVKDVFLADLSVPKEELKPKEEINGRRRRIQYVNPDLARVGTYFRVG